MLASATARPDLLQEVKSKMWQGFLKLIVKRLEMKARVEIIKIELSKTHKMLSGRALYWMILHELRQSHNTIGLMNINDLNQVNCRGPSIHHLRMFQTHWDKCLVNFEDLPSEGTLEPLYTKQVKRSDAFKLCMQTYEIELVTGIGGQKIERSFPRLQDLVRKFLDIQQVNENDDLANNPQKNSNGYSMVAMKELSPN